MSGKDKKEKKDRSSFNDYGVQDGLYSLQAGQEFNRLTEEEISLQFEQMLVSFLKVKPSFYYFGVQVGILDASQEFERLTIEQINVLSEQLVSLGFVFIQQMLLFCVVT